MCRAVDTARHRPSKSFLSVPFYTKPPNEVKRQFNSGLCERLVLSRNKKGIRDLAREGQVIAKPEDILKEPYVLGFLGLEERAKYSETDLETAIIDKIEGVLLELGKGFLFEARQKRFTFDEDLRRETG